MTGHTVILKNSDEKVIAIYRTLANEAQAISWAEEKINYWNEQNPFRKEPVKMKALVYDVVGHLVTRRATDNYEMAPLFEVIQ